MGPPARHATSYLSVVQQVVMHCAMVSEVKAKSGGAVRTTGQKLRRTQAERAAESDRRLLRAALKLIAERGYRNTSLAAIGEEAGYSRGLVNDRFGSKAGLLWALVK